MIQSPQPIHSRQRLVNISCFVVWFGYSSVQALLIWWHGYGLEPAINDSLVSATVLAIACFIIANALNHYLPSNRHYFHIAIWGLVLSLASLSLSRWILGYIISDEAYMDGVDHSLPLRFCFQAMMIAWVATINILWNIQQEHKEHQQRKLDAERLAREAELYNLRQQLQPHFLFNSLNSIIALIGKNPEQAKDMTFQLSDFLRGTLRKDDQESIALKEELDHLRLYLDIEKVRFGHRMETRIQSTERADACVLPAMILQPLVENAIKFGLYDTKGQVVIDIEASYPEENKLLEIKISNPYGLQRKPTRKGTGFGLRGVQRRLFLLFGRTDLLDAQGDGEIFTCRIQIPQN